MNDSPDSIGIRREPTTAGKPTTSEVRGEAGKPTTAGKPDYHRILSDMSRKRLQRQQAEPSERARKLREPASPRGEPEMTADGFYKELCGVLPPKDCSDRTTFRKIAGWTYRKCKYEGHNEFELCARILDFARTSQEPPARNPRAVFVSLLKKELGYPK